MLKIENTKVYGFEEAIRGMRNPLLSYERSDSRFAGNTKGDIDAFDDCYHDICGRDYSNVEVFEHYDDYPKDTLIGQNDKDLMKRLASAGKDHAKYRRMIVVSFDMTAPLYHWKEFDTYKVGTVANSCSTMHKIQEKEFTLDDFSHEHLDDAETCYEEDVGDPSLNPCYTSLDILKLKIKALNYWRDRYNETKDKHAWYQMIQLLDSSYNQRRTVMLNYEVLANIYPARKAHKLSEWHTFCDWIESLPESWIITGEEKE